MTAIGQTAVTARQSLTDRNRCKTVGRFDLLVQAGIGRLFKTSERRYATEELFLGSL